MITIYEVMCESDMTEGRGGKRVVNRFVSEEDAWKFANEHTGIMGRKPPSGDWRDYSGGRDWDVKAVQVWGENEYNSKEVARQKALAKLTPEERELLNL